MKKESSSLYLLDANVLLALAWPNHQFHAAATRAMGRSRGRWATCALTQLGFIRLSSNPAAIPGAKGRRKNNFTDSVESCSSIAELLCQG